MANAKKCDRCKEYYDGNKIEGIGLQKDKKVMLSHIHIETIHDYTDSELDLCDSCIKHLHAFLNLKGINKEVSKNAE